MWKREEERDRGRRKEEPFSFAIQNCCLCPSVLRQNGADDWLSLLPCVGSAAPLGLPPASCLLQYCRYFSRLQLPLSPVLSLSSPSHAHTKHITRSLTRVMLARLYLLCKVRCKVPHCLSFSQTLDVRSLQSVCFIYLIF